jgi:primosomal protein N' (replication factor Y)
VAKGLDFPNLTLVAVAQADASLAFPDFRAAERTFQLLVQVAGRAGRQDKPGKVLIQTRMPEHACLKAAALQHFESFFDMEMRERRALGYPPFSRLAALTLRSRDKARALATAVELGGRLAKATAASGRAGLTVLGPAPAPLVQVKGWWRYRLLVKSPESKALHELLRPEVEGFRVSGCLLAVDVDPISFL